VIDAAAGAVATGFFEDVVPLVGARRGAPPPEPASRSAPTRFLRCSARSDVFFHQLLQLRWLLVGIFALAAFVDVFE